MSKNTTEREVNRSSNAQLLHAAGAGPKHAAQINVHGSVAVARDVELYVFFIILEQVGQHAENAHKEL